MADWNTPTLPTAYVTWAADILAREVDALTMQVAAITNPPNGAFKYVRASDKFQEWTGAAYVDKVLSLAGGGTGASSAGAARTSLGLGDMATQSSTAVAITGGAVAANLTGSVSIPAAGLTGTIAQARLGSGSGGAGTKVLFDDQTYKIPATTYENIVATLATIQSADFTATFGFATYPLSGSHVVTLPTVSGNAGKRIAFVNTDGGRWTINCNGAETLFGLTSFKFTWGKYSSIVIEANATSNLWEVVASYPKGKLLLYENNGSNTSAGAATYESFTISGLDDADTLVIELSVCNTGTGGVSSTTLNNSTDAVALVSDPNNLSGGDAAIWRFEVKRCQDSNKHIMTAFLGRPTTSGTAALSTVGQQSTFLTAFTGTITYALAHAGIAAGGNIKWYIRVYKE